ncbi:MAG: secondary thiamine-phosphate synthase enzyme YjbQ [Spirochaeta sp.]|jgi:secondary thiamine-phosphate synthase enzyme|nr:secondary thiamine-phosphate synthase enzyme YjbQ [Spirochaeta sp.]
MEIKQNVITIQPRRRGFHLITDEVAAGVPELADFETGVVQVMILHTSAGLSIHETADPDVGVDFETIFNKLVPEGDPDYVHTMEGRDDMPAHVKAALVGSNLTIPVRGGRLLLGTWQGLYLCEFRNNGGARRVAVTVMGTKR